MGESRTMNVLCQVEREREVDAPKHTKGVGEGASRATRGSIA